MKIQHYIVFVFILFGSLRSFSQDSTVSKKTAWYVPEYAKIQFAGNIGFITAGAGYHLFKRKLYSEILYGHVPRRISKSDKIRTITIKNTFPIYRKQLNKYTLSPIAGFTVSVETGNNSFTGLPSKFPENYYKTNAFHATVFLGGMVHKEFKKSKTFKGLDFYYEIGTVGTYLWYTISQKGVSVTDTFSSALGVNFYF